MRNTQEIRTLIENVERQVNMYRERGISKPMTPLERAAFEEGRLSVLQWLIEDTEHRSDSAKAKK